MNALIATETQKQMKESLRGARYQVVVGIAVDFGPLNATETFMPSKTKRNGKAGRGFAPRSVMPGVKIVKTLRVTSKCGHETDHPLNTPRKWLRAATQRMCLDCECREWEQH